jgi:hypothetical protein
VAVPPLSVEAGQVVVLPLTLQVTVPVGVGAPVPPGAETLAVKVMGAP